MTATMRVYAAVMVEEDGVILPDFTLGSLQVPRFERTISGLGPSQRYTLTPATGRVQIWSRSGDSSLSMIWIETDAPILVELKANRASGSPDKLIEFAVGVTNLLLLDTSDTNSNSGDDGTYQVDHAANPLTHANTILGRYDEIAIYRRSTETTNANVKVAVLR